MKARSHWVRRLSALPLFLLFACGGAQSPGERSGGGSDIARVHRARCGACHERVEPGTRSREVLEGALTRHRTRVRLSEEQWAAMLDYLAPPPPAASAAAVGPSAPAP